MDHKAVHRNLGELAAVANQTEETERRILRRAGDMLERARKAAAAARPGALAGDDKQSRAYQAAVEERGRLEQVIEAANRALYPSKDSGVLNS